MLEVKRGIEFKVWQDIERVINIKVVLIHVPELTGEILWQREMGWAR